MHTQTQPYSDISEERIKEILTRYDQIMQELSARLMRLNEELAGIRAERIPDEWICADALSGGSIREACSGSVRTDAGFGDLLDRFEAFRNQSMDEKYHQIEAVLRTKQEVSRVMCACDVLPRILREVLSIVYMECGVYSVGISEAAQRLQVSKSTVERRRKQGIEGIRKIFISPLSTDEIIALTPDETNRLFIRKYRRKPTRVLLPSPETEDADNADVGDP